MSNKIAEYRKRANLNQAELGAILGVAQNTISGWERGYREPDHASMTKLSEVLNADITHFMGWVDAEHEEGAREHLREEYSITSLDDYPEVVRIAQGADRMDKDQRRRMLIIVENAFPKIFDQVDNPD